MRYLPVHWCEGLFLRPHHFQAADRYWTEALAASESWDHAYNYGIRHIRISREAIGNSQVEIAECQARMKDGTLISVEPGQDPDRVDLRNAFNRDSTVRVYLAVPKLKLGAPNVAGEAYGPNERYLARNIPVQDESGGGNDQDIELRTLNLRVLLSSDDLEGYEVLPVAQVKRAGEREATPQLDDSYIPPVLAVDAWPVLERDYVRAIYDIIGQKVSILTEQVVNRGIGLGGQQPGDFARILMLHELNKAYATLGVLVFGTGVHPFVAYTELCRILGQLAVFGPHRRVPDDIPRYNHDDLQPIFEYVKRQIQVLLDALPELEYEQEFFRGEGLGMAVTLSPKWLGGDWDWFVGVSQEGLAEQECMTLLDNLNWKLGSKRQVGELFERGGEGVRLTKVSQVPRALPTTANWLYYRVSRGNRAWNDVVATQTLAMRLQDRLILNRDDLQGKEELVVQAGAKRVTMRFALFAVPTQASPS